MNYQEAVDFISSTYKFGVKLGLENISRLLERLGNPQEKFKIIHVAGTNGKGSTCSMLSSILVEEGYKTGYAHLKDEASFKIGDEVNQGDKIGTTGMTGRASGEHVHFFIMKDDSRLSNTMEFIQ